MKNYKDLKKYDFSKSFGYTSKSVKYLVVGNFGAYNHGDNAILSGQLRELKKNKKVNINVVSRFPKQVVKTHSVASFSFFDFKKLIFNLATSNRIIIGGGGLFCKNSNGIRGNLFQLYFLTFFLMIPSIIRKDIFALGIGFYENTGTFFKRLSLFFLRNAKEITVRDFESFDLLSRCALNVKIFRDNSFLMPITIKKDKFFEKGTKKVNIGIALKRPTEGNQAIQLLNKISHFIDEYKKDANFWFYSLDTHPNYYNDLDYGKELYRNLQTNLNSREINFYFIPPKWSTNRTFASFKYMDFLVGMRFHSLVFAYRMGIPFYGISYDDKCSSFLVSIKKDYTSVKDLVSLNLSEKYKALT